MRPAYPDKQQAAKRGIGFQALDNGFRSVQDADALAGICATLCWRDVERFLGVLAGQAALAAER